MATWKEIRMRCLFLLVLSSLLVGCVTQSMTKDTRPYAEITKIQPSTLQQEAAKVMATLKPDYANPIANTPYLIGFFDGKYVLLPKKDAQENKMGYWPILGTTPEEAKSTILVFRDQIAQEQNNIVAVKRARMGAYLAQQPQMIYAPTYAQEPAPAYAPPPPLPTEKPTAGTQLQEPALQSPPQRVMIHGPNGQVLGYGNGNGMGRYNIHSPNGQYQGFVQSTP